MKQNIARQSKTFSHTFYDALLVLSHPDLRITCYKMASNLEFTSKNGTTRSTPSTATFAESIAMRIGRELDIESGLKGFFINYTSLIWCALLTALLVFFVINLPIQGTTSVLLVVLFRGSLYGLASLALNAMSRLAGFDILLFFTSWSIHIVLGGILPHRFWDGARATLLTLLRSGVTIVVWIIAAYLFQQVQPGASLAYPIYTAGVPAAFITYGKWQFFCIMLVLTSIQIYFVTRVHLAEAGYELLHSSRVDQRGKIIPETVEGYYGPMPRSENSQPDSEQTAERRRQAAVPWSDKALKVWLTLIDQPVNIETDDRIKFSWVLLCVKVFDFMFCLLSTGSPLIIEQLIASYAVGNTNEDLGFWIGLRLIAVPVSIVIYMIDYYKLLPIRRQNTYSQLQMSDRPQV